MRAFFAAGPLVALLAGAAAAGALPAPNPALRLWPVEGPVAVRADPPLLPDDPGLGVPRPLLGARTRGPDLVRLTIGPEAADASSADHVALHFAEQAIWLMGTGSGFPAGLTLRYDLAGVAWFLDGLPVDSWDALVLALDSPDELGLTAVQVVRHGQAIVDWSGRALLAAAPGERFGLAQAAVDTKLAQSPGPANDIAFWALLELGKDDGSKYSEQYPGGWCSEFAAWVLRHHGWATPAGSIGTRHLREFFEPLGRLYSIEEIYAGAYAPGMGDYLSMWSGGHSGLFLAFLDEPGQPGPATRILTIEGGFPVQLCERSLADIDHVANAR